MKHVTLIIAIALSACSPAKLSRIGPKMPARPDGCEVEILEEGVLPGRPYRDIGSVALENCQDYRVPPCSRWLADAVCELGGQIAYLPENDRPTSHLGPVTFQLMVATYVSELRPDGENDPFLKSLCDPPCQSGEVCRQGECKPADGADCEPPEPAPKQEQSPDRCVE